MKCHGLQKLTLLDFPEHVACTVFTAGCNLRCPFCHNALLVTDIQPGDAVSEEELFSFLKKRRGMLDGVAVTGGEPLLQPDLADFLRRVKALEFDIKLDTNGCYPERLKALLDEGLLSYAAMDVKNTPEKYPETVGVPDFDVQPVRESMKLLRLSGIPYEFRTTAVKEFHRTEDIIEIARWLRDEGAPRYFIQNFRDSGGLIGENLHPVPRETMFEMRDKAAEILPCTALRGLVTAARSVPFGAGRDPSP